MTYRHGFVRLKSRARRQVQRKTWNSGERPGHSLMTAFLKFANLADIVLARDSAAVQLWHVVKVRAAGFGVSCAVSSRSYSTTPWSETTIEDRCSIAIPALITSIVRRYQAWRRYETVRRELSHLTDRELTDIGITRSDIERIASGEAHS
jgi:uncharacterized protein YjiS (DUF1127 family)